MALCVCVCVCVCVSVRAGMEVVKCLTGIMKARNSPTQIFSRGEAKCKLSCMSGELLSVLLFPVDHSELSPFRCGSPVEGWRLLYRASHDGFNAKDFHRHCDGKGPSVVIAKVRTARH